MALPSYYSGTKPSAEVEQEAMTSDLSGASYSSLPSYMVAGDTLNAANRNRTWGEAILDAPGTVTKFVATSLVAGVNEIFNIPANVGNLFGGEFETTKTEDILAGMDSDLNQFYQDNKPAVDLVGFIASSIVPGTAGIKVLNAGQRALRGALAANKFGKNTGAALGLLAPNKQKLMAQAVAEVANNSAPATVLNANGLKAIAAGATQGLYEALAFETAVTATMYNSPILENQDFKDFALNVAYGAGAFGLIGGAIDVVKLRSAIKGAADKAAVEARPWEFINETAGASTAYEKLIADYDQLNTLRNTPLPADVDPHRLNYLKQTAKSTEERLQGRILVNMRQVAGGDEAVTRALYSGFKSADLDSQITSIAGLAEASRYGAKNPTIDVFEKLTAKVQSGKAAAKEVEDFLASDTVVGYVKSWGEDAGNVLESAPKVTHLADTLAKGESVIVEPTRVKAGSREFKFDLKYNKGIKPKLGTATAWEATAGNVLESQARYAWVNSLPKFTPTDTAPLFVHVNDIPMLEKVALELADSPERLTNVKLQGLDTPMSATEVAANFVDYVAERKLIVATTLAENAAKKGAVKLTQDEIASIVNVKSSMLGGEIKQTSVSNFHPDDMFAYQSHAADYTKKLVEQGDWKAEQGIVDIFNVPQLIKLAYKTGGDAATGRAPIAGVGSNFVVENMAIIKEQQRLYQNGVDKAVAQYLGKDFELLEPITSQRVKAGAKPSGAGAGFLTSASSNYGSLAASVENLGNVTTRLINKAQETARTTLEPLLYRLGSKPEAAIEWSTLNANLRAIEGNYTLNAVGDALMPVELVKWEAAAQRAANESLAVPARPSFPANKPERIAIKNKEVLDLVKAHIDINGKRTFNMAGIRAAQGSQFRRDPSAFYPLPIDPRDYKYFALVTDRSITSGNHQRTLFASSANELDGMITKLKSDNPHLEIRTKAEAERYYKEQGQFDYEKTLTDNYLDTAAKREGVSAPYLPATDPEKIVTDTLKWHMQREAGLIREAISAKYEVQFEEMLRLGEKYTNVQTSKFAASRAEQFGSDVTDNPFADYIKTALALKKTSDYPWWVKTNQMADQAVSKMYQKIDDIFESSKSPADLDKINATLKESGYQGAHYDATMELFANAEPAKGTLSAIVQKANSMLATVVLRWDALNAVNNAVSANVLLGAETKAVLRAINAGDSEAVGALAELAYIKVPGTDKTIFSPQKLIANAVKKFGTNTPEMQWFKDNGFMTKISDQYKDAIDSITFGGKEGVRSWENNINGLYAKLRKAGDAGEKWTGNKLAEEFNRFVAADVMKQLTDVGVQRGLISAKEQVAYINTFVNRTQGNYLASQRPMMFSGPVGNAIGLFQTYQFNLMQQLLRHVGEGRGKDAMTLLALQGTIHGMNGLPAFNAINTHLIGTASGNTEHKDIYSTVYGAAGKEAGDWLMYGLASNMFGLLHPDLKTNLYTRGDINPRHLTIVPTNPSRVPIVQSTAKVLGNLFSTAEKLATGADVSKALLQGLEHNGISRPLAGLAQVLEGLDNPQSVSYSTTKKGDVVMANDLLSLSNLTRLAGGKPLDEAITIDATYRFKAYALQDAKKRNVLGQAIKTKLIEGGELSSEDMEGFMQKYVEAGGKQKQFNSWVTSLYKTANTNQANKIRESLNSPFSQSMQRLMGDEALRDFSSD